MEHGGPGAKPTVKDIIGETRMQPKPGTGAPINTDVRTGRIEVGGYAVGDATNVSKVKARLGPSDSDVLEQRRKAIADRTSADSPDDRVVEGVGIAARRAHEMKDGPQ